MIQSRGQFGFYGAGFISRVDTTSTSDTAASQVLQGQALNLWAPSVSIPWWIIIATISRGGGAIFGYRWIQNCAKGHDGDLHGGDRDCPYPGCPLRSGPHESLGFGLSSFPIFIAVIAWSS